MQRRTPQNSNTTRSTRNFTILPVNSHGHPKHMSPFDAHHRSRYDDGMTTHASPVATCTAASPHLTSHRAGRLATSLSHTRRICLQLRCVTSSHLAPSKRRTHEVLALTPQHLLLWKHLTYNGHPLHAHPSLCSQLAAPVTSIPSKAVLASRLASRGFPSE